MLKPILRRLHLLADHQSSLSVSYLVYVLALGFSGSVQLGLLFLLARLLPIRELGLVTLLMVSIPLACRFVTLGSDIGLSIRIWKQPRTEQKADLSSMLTWTAAIVVALLVPLLIAGLLAGPAFGSMLLGCALLAAGFRACAEIFQVMLRREGRVVQVGLVVVVRALLFALVCVSALLIIGRSALAYLLGVLVAESLTALWGLGHLHRLYDLGLFEPGSIARMKGLVRVGFPSIPGMAAALLLAAGDRFVITALLGLAATGVYALGQRLAEAVVQILFVPFASAFGPIALSVASEDQRRAFVLIGQTAMTFAYLGGAALGVPVVVGREVILALAGSEYALGATVFLLVIAAVLVFQISQILAVYFSQTEQLRRYMWIIIGAAATNIVLNIIAVRAFGIIGAALVSLIVYEGVLIAAVLTARRAGVSLISPRRLHLPLLLFGIYLGMIFGVDSQGLRPASAIFVKTILWAGYVTLCIAVSLETRAVIAGVAQRSRVFLAS